MKFVSTAGGTAGGGSLFVHFDIGISFAAAAAAAVVTAIVVVVIVDFVVFVICISATRLRILAIPFLFTGLDQPIPHVLLRCIPFVLSLLILIHPFFHLSFIVLITIHLVLRRVFLISILFHLFILFFFTLALALHLRLPPCRQPHELGPTRQRKTLGGPPPIDRKRQTGIGTVPFPRFERGIGPNVVRSSHEGPVSDFETGDVHEGFFAGGGGGEDLGGMGGFSEG
mmetsp:Transcript_21284/g.44263  ORF Transcript_21284/g.44263 Transcript_21284/m.44263 type:complete len:227 (+) Transcript_21284:801-1481(+)